MLTGMAECAIPTETDPARIRGERARDLRGDCSALREATGWDRTIPLEQTLRDVLDEQRHRVRGGARSESRPAR